MSDTPRTDAVTFNTSEMYYSQVVVADFARQLESERDLLERELALRTRQADRLWAAFGKIYARASAYYRAWGPRA